MRHRNNLNIGLLLLRLGVGGLMLLHGIHKLRAPMDTIDFLSKTMVDAGLPGFISYGVFLGEVIAPILIVLGWRTKLFAPFIAITMLIAIYTKHPMDAMTLTQTGGLAIELQVLYLVGALALSFTGGGKFAISHKNQWD